MMTSTTLRRSMAPAHVVVLAGVCAAMHLGKLAPAITTLRQALGMSLLEAGFLLSLIQFAGMCAGLAFGALADGLGLRRSMVGGLSLLALASAAGGMVDEVPILMLLRALEGCGFLLVVLAAPGLLRRLVPAAGLPAMMGLWGAYMPLATAAMLLAGPLWIGAFGWRSWWTGLAGITLLMAWWLARSVPATLAAPPAGPAAGAPSALQSRLRQTLAARGPWLLAGAFAAYSAQWLAVIGFLPAIYAQAGWSSGAVAPLTALVAAVNMLGNIASGRLALWGLTPPRVLAAGFAVMALTATAAFAGDVGAGLPPALRYAALLLFSLVGGIVPGTLFGLVVRAAPSEQTMSTTVGWMQQWSAFGQFVGPPLVAWVSSRTGGWQWTWLVTGSCALIGLSIAGLIGRWLRRLPV